MISNGTTELAKELLENPQKATKLIGNKIQKPTELIGKKVLISCTYIYDAPVGPDTPAFYLKGEAKHIQFAGKVRSVQLSDGVLIINFGGRLGEKTRFIENLKLSRDAQGNLKWQTYLNMPYADFGVSITPEVSFCD